MPMEDCDDCAGRGYHRSWFFGLKVRCKTCHGTKQVYRRHLTAPRAGGLQDRLTKVSPPPLPPQPERDQGSPGLHAAAVAAVTDGDVLAAGLVGASTRSMALGVLAGAVHHEEHKHDRKPSSAEALSDASPTAVTQPSSESAPAKAEPTAPAAAEVKVDPAPTANVTQVAVEVGTAAVGGGDIGGGSPPGGE